MKRRLSAAITGLVLVCFVFSEALAAPALSVVKSVLPATISAAGQTVVYSFLVTNTGDTTLTGISVTDLFLGAAVTCPTTTLDLGQSMTCTATYTASQPDIDAGAIVNTAVAIGTAPGGLPIASNPSTATVGVVAGPALSVVKSVLPATISAAGQAVVYSFLVTNTGNVTLIGISVADVFFSGSGAPPVITCPTVILFPGQSMTCTATYTATQADIVAGTIVNTAVATGIAPGGLPTTSTPSTAMVLTPNADLSVIKTSPATVPAGTNLTYGITMTNNGPQDAANVAFSDPIPPGATFVSLASPAGFTCTTPAVGSGGTVSCTAPSLAAGASSNLQLVISIPMGLAGSIISNTATVTATMPDPNLPNNSSTASTTAILVPTITSLSPPSRTATAPGFTLTVNGTNYLNNMTVRWNGTNLATTFVGATQLTAAVPANLIAASGSADIMVVTADGVSSNAAAFTIGIAPAITGLSPDSVTAGQPAFTLTVNGANFVDGMTVQWNGSSLATTFVSASQLTAAVPAALVAAPGSATVAVVSVDGVASSPATFTVVNAAVITQVPTMTEWGVILFMVLAGFGSVYSLRKYRRA